MQYLTDRKRATGLGASRSGTHHHWAMQVSAVALSFLVIAFILTFGSILGAPYDAVKAYYHHPFPAIVAALTIIVGLNHFRMGAQMMLEDYARGTTLKALIVAVTCISYAAIATGLFGLIRLVL